MPRRRATAKRANPHVNPPTSAVECEPGEWVEYPDGRRAQVSFVLGGVRPFGRFADTWLLVRLPLGTIRWLGSRPDEAAR